MSARKRAPAPAASPKKARRDWTIDPDPQLRKRVRGILKEVKPLIAQAQKALKVALPTQGNAMAGGLLDQAATVHHCARSDLKAVQHLERYSAEDMTCLSVLLAAAWHHADDVDCRAVVARAWDVVRASGLVPDLLCAGPTAAEEPRSVSAAPSAPPPLPLGTDAQAAQSREPNWRGETAALLDYVEDRLKAARCIDTDQCPCTISLIDGSLLVVKSMTNIYLDASNTQPESLLDLLLPLESSVRGAVFLPETPATSRLLLQEVLAKVERAPEFLDVVGSDAPAAPSATPPALPVAGESATAMEPWRQTVQRLVDFCEDRLRGVVHIEEASERTIDMVHETLGVIEAMGSISRDPARPFDEVAPKLHRLKSLIKEAFAWAPPQQRDRVLLREALAEVLLTHELLLVG